MACNCLIGSLLILANQFKDPTGWQSPTAARPVQKAHHSWICTCVSEARIAGLPLLLTFLCESSSAECQPGTHAHRPHTLLHAELDASKTDPLQQTLAAPASWQKLKGLRIASQAPLDQKSGNQAWAADLRWERLVRTDAGRLHRFVHHGRLLVPTLCSSGARALYHLLAELLGFATTLRCLHLTAVDSGRAPLETPWERPCSLCGQLPLEM